MKTPDRERQEAARIRVQRLLAAAAGAAPERPAAEMAEEPQTPWRLGFMDRRFLRAIRIRPE